MFKAVWLLRTAVLMLGLAVLWPGQALAISLPKLSVDAAQRLMFPDASTFEPQAPAVIQRWQKAIANDMEVYLLGAHFQVWRVTRGGAFAGWFVTDEVVGKFEKVDYAVALAPDGAVLRVEVMRYRESHGQEVMQRNWLAQFEGKSAASALKVERDIDGISGATLSCVHLADGVRRVSRLIAAGAREGAGR